MTLRKGRLSFKLPFGWESPAARPIPQESIPDSQFPPYAKLTSNDLLSGDVEDSEDEGDDAMDAPDVFTQPKFTPAAKPPTGATKPPVVQSNVRPLGSAIPVSKDCVMNVMAAGEVTQQGIEQLVAYLNLIKGSFPKDGNN